MDDTAARLRISDKPSPIMPRNKLPKPHLNRRDTTAATIACYITIAW